MSAQEIVEALKALGATQKYIADVLGRNDSIVSQIAKGKKSGASYVPALEELHTRVAEAKRAGGPLPDRAALRGEVVQPDRRLNKLGQRARVRGAAYYNRGWTARVGAAAARNGAPSLRRLLADAADARLNVAWTVVFKPPARRGGGTPVKAERKSGKAATHGPGTKFGGGKPKPGSISIEFKTEPQDLLDRTGADHGGNLTAALCAVASERGIISGDATPDRVFAIEMRAW